MNEKKCESDYRIAINQLLVDFDRMRNALEAIAAWKLPTGQFHDDGTPKSYGYCWGSNGERDYMRKLANLALPQTE
jgi:hypothetical protein